MRMRPCGACRALVSAASGCEHWVPGRSAKAADSAARRHAERMARPVVATPVKAPRERSREEKDHRNELARARYAAKVAADREKVAEFARVMNGEHR
jgi:hypothetical protein